MEFVIELAQSESSCSLMLISHRHNYYRQFNLIKLLTIYRLFFGPLLCQSFNRYQRITAMAIINVDQIYERPLQLRQREARTRTGLKDLRISNTKRNTVYAPGT